MAAGAGGLSLRPGSVPALGCDQRQRHPRPLADGVLHRWRSRRHDADRRPGNRRAADQLSAQRAGLARHFHRFVHVSGRHYPAGGAAERRLGLLDSAGAGAGTRLDHALGRQRGVHGAVLDGRGPDGPAARNPPDQLARDAGRRAGIGAGIGRDDCLCQAGPARRRRGSGAPTRPRRRKPPAPLRPQRRPRAALVLSADGSRRDTPRAGALPRLGFRPHLLGIRGGATAPTI